MQRDDIDSGGRGRVRHWMAVLWCLALLTAPLLWTTSPARADTPSITDFIKRPGDQIVTVPDGTYTGGTVTAPHGLTNGPFKGWLVLTAQSPRGVVVDLSKTRLTLESGTSRVLFVGFKFINGTITVRGDDVAFWYTEHTFPIEEWNRQYQAAGGNADGLKKMENALPKAIWVGEESTRTVWRTQVLGADVHDVGDDGVFVDHAESPLIQGTRIWNVDRKTYDPGYNPWLPQYKDLFHNDAVQVPGSVSNMVMADSYAGTTMNIGGDNASATNLQFKNLWIAGSFGLGFDFFVQKGNRLTGSMQDIRAWGNGTQHTDDPGWDQLRVDFNDNNGQATWPASLNDPRLNVASLGNNLNQQPPPGVTMAGRRMIDPSQAIDNPLNPATMWRAAHPYNSWPALFGLPVPGIGAAAAEFPSLLKPATPAPAATGQAATGAAQPKAAAPTKSASKPKAVTAPAKHENAAAPVRRPSAPKPKVAPKTPLVHSPGLIDATGKGPIGTPTDALPRLAVILALMAIATVGFTTFSTTVSTWKQSGLAALKSERRRTGPKRTVRRGWYVAPERAEKTDSSN